MSLINDALKRVSQSRPPAETPLTPPLQPAPSNRQPRSSAVGILLAFIACAVVLAGWFFWKGSSSSTRQPNRPAQVAQKTPLAPAPAKMSKPVVPVATALPTQELSIVTAPAPTVSTHPSEPPTPSIAPEPTPEPPTFTNAQSAISFSTPPSQPEPPTLFPDLQVKAIAYHPTHGKAIINNRAIGAGEEIDGVRILKIEPSKVTVEWNGQKKEIFLE